MRITVRVYAALREAVGGGCIEIEVPEGAVMSDVLDRIADEYPESRPFRQVMRGAVDDAYVHADVTIDSQDEIHVITPVSGG